MISATVALAALALAYFIARVLWGDYQAQRRAARQARCRNWIERKLRSGRPEDHYEAQVAFKLLISRPDWEARGPWEWEDSSLW
jgi:hypothetical protein